MKIVSGFTLIELLIAIAIAAVIIAALYFSLDAALKSWEYSKTMLALQKTLSETMDNVVNGTAATYGIRDGLEIITAGSERIEYVPPWTDDTHTSACEDFIYTLNRRIKPGSAVPVGEIKLPGSDEYQTIPLQRLELEDNRLSKVRLGLDVPSGSSIKFIYHPDREVNSDVAKAIWWDSATRQVYSEDINGIENISRNPFGIKITGMKLCYYDNANKLITDSKWLSDRELNAITGVEVYMEAQAGQYNQSIISFVALRNAPRRSGYLALRKGTKISIPDSRGIHTLLLTNFSGISSGDELRLEAAPKHGKAWRVNIKFSRADFAGPKIESYTIEYPPGHPVYTAYPKVGADIGLNLLTLGSDGLYDYDDEEDLDDVVALDGDVMLEVAKMDIEGAGLFVRP